VERSSPDGGRLGWSCKKKKRLNRIPSPAGAPLRRRAGANHISISRASILFLEFETGFIATA
jgi:hypothetical protein